MTTKLFLKVSLLSLIFCVNGQFKHFPAVAGRPDSPTNVRQQPAREVARPRPAPVDLEENEVIPVTRNRGRGRARGTQSRGTPQTPQRLEETQRPQRGRTPERSREVFPPAPLR